MKSSPLRASSPGAAAAQTLSLQEAASSSVEASPSPQRREPPKVFVDGSALAEDGQAEQEVDDEAERLQKLEKLRAQLERSELNRRSPSISQGVSNQDGSNRTDTPGQPNADTQDASSDANALKNSQRSRRRVQWVGLTADDEFRQQHHRRPASVDRTADHRAGHVSVSVPSTPQTEDGEFIWPNVDGTSDGMQTPAGNTPDVSRPGTPEDVPYIPAGERDGLPLPSSSKRGRTFAREAAKLVAVHKAKTMFRSKRKCNLPKSSSATARNPLGNSAPLRSEAADVYYNEKPQEARTAASGGGVLSALLKLYEQPQSERSSQATLVTSTASTPEGLPPALRPFQGGSSRPVTESSTASARAFADEVRRRGDIQLNNMLNGTAGPKHAGGVFADLQQKEGVSTDSSQVPSSSATPMLQRPGHMLGRMSMPEIPTLGSLAVAPCGLSSPGPSSTSRRTSPERPLNIRRKTGSNLALNNLVKMPENLARSGEKLARESLDPKRYHRESAALKAAKSRENSPSTPGTPRLEYDEKTPIRRRKKDKKRQEEIFITMHVAAILQRQDFILRFARALMMFGAPPHRIEYQLQQTALVLQIECQVIYIVNFMIISFSDAQTHTSEIRFIKQFGGLDLTKLTEIAILHWEVVHDKIGVEEASVEISNLMKAKPTYSNWHLIGFGSMASAMIGIAAFSASFIDLLVAIPLGGLLVATQCFIAARSDVLSSIFEIVIAAVISFVAAGLASTTKFCYASITSASIVLILPGWPTCLAALELQSRSLVSGSVRIVYAVVYSLFLGFGISMGANVWQLVSGQDVYTSNDNKCTGSHPADGPWYQQTIPQWFYFLAVPGFPLCLSLRNHAKPNKELLAMVLIAGCGWTANHFSTYGFPGRSDISSALGAFTVGVISNLYGKMFQSTAFIVAATPIMFQLPSGLGNGGLLNWATTDADDQVVFSSGWSVAQQLIQVVIGLVVGLLVACAVIYPFGKRRGGLMTF